MPTVRVVLRRGFVVVGFVLLASGLMPACTSSEPSATAKESVSNTAATGPSALAMQSVSTTAAPIIATVSYFKHRLIINGSGFGGTGASVMVNGQDVSSRIEGQSDTLIELKGTEKKLSLRRGPNQISVSAGGVPSNVFVLNL